MRIPLLLFAALCASCQTGKPKPAITDAQKIRVVNAENELLKVQPLYANLQAELANKDIIATCEKAGMIAGRITGPVVAACAPKVPPQAPPKK